MSGSTSLNDGTDVELIDTSTRRKALMGSAIGSAVE